MVRTTSRKTSDTPKANKKASPITPTLSQARLPIPPAAWIVLAITFVILILHIWMYAFQCDDAYISFRYARNFANGHGLVFNPGYERVEGYTNFLWVLILAGAKCLGAEIHHAANPLSISCGLALWIIVVRFCLNQRTNTRTTWWILFPAFMLAANRSFALWCTSGLETKLFELLCVAGVLRCITEVRSADTNSVIGSLLLALAALTRPDGLLIAVCVLSTRWSWQLITHTATRRALLTNALVFTVPVACHFIFRRLYYQDWLPNTYYAKVGGKAWWDMGGRYLAMFSLEYGLIFWAPVLFVAAVALFRDRRAIVLLILLSAIVPHALYVASIGGDHFEYRPLDLYFPFLFILMYYGFTALQARVHSALLLAYALLCAVVSTSIPLMTHLDSPNDYRPGFPGDPEFKWPNRDLVDKKCHPILFSIPLVNSYLQTFDSLAARLSVQFVALRQEEHSHFLEWSRKEGLWLADLVKSGVFPPDLYIATDCVGAIPYFSGLRTLDRLGLTDRVVARQASVGTENSRMMAHDKRANPKYGVQMGVDIWSADSVYFIVPEGHPAISYDAQLAKKLNWPLVAADVGDHRYLLVIAPQGPQSLAQRLPRLRLLSPDDLLQMDAQKPFVPVPREQQFALPYDEAFVGQGEDLIAGDLPNAARDQFERALKTNPENKRAISMLRRLQRMQEASTHPP